MFSLNTATLYNFYRPIIINVSSEKRLSKPRICAKMPRERSEQQIRITSPYNDFHENYQFFKKRK